MRKLLASLAVAGLFAIGCNEQPASKPTTTTNTGAQRIAPAPIKPQADMPPTTSGTSKPESDKKDKKDNGDKGGAK